MWDRHCLLVTFCPRIMVCSHGPSFGWYARYLMAWGWPDSGPLSMETFYWEADPSNQGFVPWGGGHTRMISPSKAHSLCKPIRGTQAVSFPWPQRSSSLPVRDSSEQSRPAAAPGIPVCKSQATLMSNMASLGLSFGLSSAFHTDFPSWACSQTCKHTNIYFWNEYKRKMQLKPSYNNNKDTESKNRQMNHTKSRVTSTKLGGRNQYK